MKALFVTAFASGLLAGCQTPVVPLPDDRTRPTLFLELHYLGERIGTTFATIRATGEMVTAPGLCLHVASPFLVIAQARDSGGISAVGVAHVINDGGVEPTRNQADIFSIPLPAERTWTIGGITYPNPGAQGTGIHARFSTARAYEQVSLYGKFHFVPGSAEAMLVVEARNFSTTHELTQIFPIYLRKAGDAPGTRPGVPCDVPVRPRG